MDPDASAFLPTTVAIAREVGTYLRSAFGSVGGKIEGGHFKSDADRRAHTIIVEGLERAFPTHAIYSEEGDNAPDFSAPYLWVIDPLDGTTNFAHGIPLFGTFLSLLEHGIPVLGVVHDPVHDETFTALRSQGAFLNERPIRAGTPPDRSGAMISMSRGSGTTEKQRHGDLYALLARSVRTIRVMNGPSGDPTYVAAGRVHAFLSNDARLYDVVAGALIAQEAGALVTDFAGNPWHTRDGDILVAASPLHAQLVEVLRPTLTARTPA